ncbi:hypothetical protein [Pseudomonas sp. CGJS7]
MREPQWVRADADFRGRCRDCADAQIAFVREIVALWTTTPMPATGGDGCA